MGGINIDKNRERSAQEGIGFEGTDIRLGNVGGVQFDPRTGEATGSVTGPNVGLAQLLTREGTAGLTAGARGREGVTALGEQQVATGADLLSTVSSFDPLTAAETRFNRLQSILDKGRNRTRDSAESRLLAQGRLGGEGGARQLSGLEAAFAEQDAQLLDRQFSEAEAARRGGIADALAVGGAGADIQTGLTEQGFRGTGMAGDVNQLGASNLLQLLQQGGQLGALETQAEIAKSNAASNLNANLIGKGGGGGFGSVLGTLAGGVVGSIGGPIGTSIGTKIGGALTGGG